MRDQRWELAQELRGVADDVEKLGEAECDELRAELEHDAKVIGELRTKYESAVEERDVLRTKVVELQRAVDGLRAKSDELDALWVRTVTLAHKLLAECDAR